MTDNAGYIEGSIRGSRIALPRSPKSIGRFYAVSENPSKIHPKSDRFCGGEFFNYSASTVYNFNTVKCTDFLTKHSSSRRGNEAHLSSLVHHPSPRPSAVLV